MPFESFTRPRPRGTVASAAVVALAAGVSAYVFTRRTRRGPGAEQDVVQEESETVYVVAGNADGAPSADTRAARMRQVSVARFAAVKTRTTRLLRQGDRDGPLLGRATSVLRRGSDHGDVPADRDVSTA